MISIATCIGLGLDSYFMSFALPSLGVKSLGSKAKDRLSWAGAFGAADAIASLSRELGASNACLALVLAIVLWNVVRREGSLLVAVPALLCIDNLLWPHAAVDPVVAGVTSFALAALGLATRGAVDRFVSERHRHKVALAAVALCAAVLLFG
jgi:hypothetical protein